MSLDDALTGVPAVTPQFWNSQAPLGILDLSTLLEIQFQAPSFLANESGGWFSNEDQMPREDAFWAGEEPVLAREPNPAYTEGMIRVTGTITIGEEESYSGSDQSNYWKLEKNEFKKDGFRVLERHF